VNLDRYLNINETIDHIDNDVQNNQLSNLRIMDRKDHVKNEIKRRDSCEFICPMCKKSFILSGKKLYDCERNRKKLKTTGPFCSKSCAGFYGASVQNGGQKIPIPEIPKATYYNLKNGSK
jgi:hypothetical protein